MVQSAVTLVTKFRGREDKNISRRFVFAGDPKNYVSRVLIFAESTKMRKIAEFYTSEN